MRRTSLTLLLQTALLLPAISLAKPQETNSLEQARHLLHEASQLVKDIPEGQQMSAAANIAGQLARAGDLGAALATVRNLKKSSEQALPLGIIAWHMDHAGQGEQALELLEKSELGQGKAAAYQQLALSHLDRGDYAGAFQVLSMIPDQPNLRVDMLIRTARQRAKSDDLPRAQEALRGALDLVEKERKEDPNCVSEIVAISGAQAEIGDQAGALATLNRFSEIAHDYQQDSNTVAWNPMLSQLAIGQAQLGDLVGAFQTVEEMPEGNNRDSALGVVAVQQAKMSEFQEALSTVSSITDPRLRAIELREIGILEGTSGKTVEALEAIRSIADAGGRADALAALALEQAEKDDPGAGRTLQLAIQAANETEEKIPGYVFGCLAVTRAVLKDFAGAQESIAAMTDPESRAWPLWSVTSMMAETGNVQGALSLVANEQAAHPKAYALLGTAQGILDRLESETKEKSKNARI